MLQGDAQSAKPQILNLLDVRDTQTSKLVEADATLKHTNRARALGEIAMLWMVQCRVDKIANLQIKCPKLKGHLHGYYYYNLLSFLNQR